MEIQSIYEWYIGVWRHLGIARPASCWGIGGDQVSGVEAKLLKVSTEIIINIIRL